MANNRKERKQKRKKRERFGGHVRGRKCMTFVKSVEQNGIGFGDQFDLFFGERLTELHGECQTVIRV